ncbi:hypothetical protein [Leucobacter komagatae]|uniref:hypothetical protein n=1 Tax=Leucobacter komagatae TaxID=55969 RepID=UPI0018DCFC84|nr:hypothetical protein [Leucobacter komagatae]
MVDNTPHSTESSMSDTATREELLGRRRAFLGAITGHLIEWYDYGVYGFLAIYIGQLFFASENPAVSLLSSFAVFASELFCSATGGACFSGRSRTALGASARSSSCCCLWRVRPLQ